MDAWKNARNIEALQKEVEQIKKHMVTLMQIVLKKDVPKKEPIIKEVLKEEPKKKGWFGGRDTDGEKN